MLPGPVAVIDFGKSLAKLSLWDEHGRLLERRERASSASASGVPGLDTTGLDHWLAEALTGLPRREAISDIVPVAHGAAAAVIRDGVLAAPVGDYEAPIPADLMAAYCAQRDAFADTGSPALPNGLNLGAQLHRLEAERPHVLTGDAQILPWPQYWAWRLSGVAASEISSLGCHTDLWRPAERAPSELARARGWAARLAPLRRASEVLGTLTPEWCARTGLAPSVRVHCGAHDSNAALFGARGFRESGGGEATVVSTGTWFVCMRSPASRWKIAALPESRDCLVNVGVRGQPVPSARFMGGREIGLLGGFGDLNGSDAELAAVPAVLAQGSMVLPSWVPGVGPFPQARGCWLEEPQDATQRQAAVNLYAALMVDASLELIGASNRVLIEGRFSQVAVFVRALAALRPDLQIYAADSYDALSYGALRLVAPDLLPPVALRKVLPLAGAVAAYRERWRQEIARRERAA